MSEDTYDQNNTTEIRHATIANSGSGNVFYQNSSTPVPNFPVNGSNLPNPHPHFVGREDKVREVIHALSSRAWIIGIDGMGGIGKTTLALEVAHICKNRNSSYPDIPHFAGYIWVSARNNPNFGLNDVIKEILYVLGPYENIKKKLSITEQLSLVYRALSAEPKLLIIDNFESIPEDEILYKFLREFPSPSKVLITSRLRINTGEQVITLGGLSEYDAVNLLRFEASRLGVPIDNQDMTRLHIIARKTFGIPFVLRWVMERVREGQLLEWAIDSLEYANADDIFGYIYNSALSLLDNPTYMIFCSMSLLSTWTSVEVIEAINAGTSAVSERVSVLVKYSLLEDNLKLTQSARRYQLHPFTRYLAWKKLSITPDKGANFVKNALDYYFYSLKSLMDKDHIVKAYLDMEFFNIENVMQYSYKLQIVDLISQSVQLFNLIRHIDSERGKQLFPSLAETIYITGNAELRLELFKIIPNPYSTGVPVRNSSMFFGREDLLEYVLNIFNKEPYAAIEIIGPRRIGKTSFLLQICSQQRNDYCYAYIDMQFLSPLSDSFGAFLFGFAREITRSIRKSTHSETLPVLIKDDFLSKPLLAFSSFINNIHKNLGDTHLVLVIDEFELMVEYIQDSQNLLAFLQYLRALASSAAYLGIITATALPLSKVAVEDGASSPFSSIFRRVYMSALDEESAKLLILKPSYGLLKYDDKAVEYILHLSGCLPYYLNILCGVIIDECNHDQKIYVDMQIVESASRMMTTYLQYDFTYRIDRLAPFEKELLTFIASNDGIRNFITVDSIRKLIKPISHLSIKGALNNLEARGLIIANKEGYYRLAAELIRLKMLEELPDEELSDLEGTNNFKHLILRDKGEIFEMGEQEQDKSKVSNVTHIGYVAGPTHTGSGDIKIDSLSYNETISTKEELLAALQAFKEKLNFDYQQGLSEEIYDDMTIEVEAAEKEIKKENSKPDRIVNRLEKAKAILVAGSSVATASSTLVDASNKLIPLIETAIHTVGKIFM